MKKQAGRSYVGIEEPEVDEFDQLKVQATAEKLAGAISDRQLISEILDSMSSTLRIPLVLCDMDELSYEEVAQSLGISLSAAKMRIKRGREEFRERYQKVQTAEASSGWRMSDEPADSEMQDGEGVDPGEPIAALAEFEHDTSSDLLARIRRTIQRRTTAAQLTSFSSSVLLLLLREFWLILVEQFNPKRTRKDASDGGETS